MVVTACEQPNDFKFLYPVDVPIKQKIETIATQIYRADGVDYTSEADKQIDTFEKNGFGNLPICMAKTHLSFTADPAIKGAPLAENPLEGIGQHVLGEDAVAGPQSEEGQQRLRVLGVEAIEVLIAR